MADEPSDGETALLAAARGGSTRAYMELMRFHQQAVRTFLRRLCGNWDEADDWAQEAFATAWFDLARYRGEASFRSWVCGIAYRKALSGIRSRSRSRARELASLEGVPSTTAGPEIEGLRMDLTQALSKLPEPQRAVVALCLAAGLTHEEAAAALNLPLGTVKSHVLRGREKIRLSLGGLVDGA